MNPRRERTLLFAATLILLSALGVAPKTDRFTWILENLPVFLVLPFLVATRERFPLSMFATRLLFLHAVVLMVGGHWSYAEVPAGHWVRDHFALARNPYDRLGHFVQGFVPAIVVRELLVRLGRIPRGKLLAFLSISVCLAFSASYELFEWLAALASGAAADAFLGTQGDPWDTQWDMFLCLVGATLATGLLSRAHDRSLEAFE